MYILGLSAMGHHSAAALLGDSGILAAIEESKLTRNRAASGIPREAIRFCLDRAGIHWNQIAHISIASNPRSAWKRQTLFRARRAAVCPTRRRSEQRRTGECRSDDQGNHGDGGDQRGRAARNLDRPAGVAELRRRAIRGAGHEIGRELGSGAVLHAVTKS